MTINFKSPEIKRITAKITSCGSWWGQAEMQLMK